MFLSTFRSSAGHVFGSIVRFKQGSSFGFICLEKGGPDVFVHKNDIKDQDKNLSLGQRVRLRLEPDPSSPGKFFARDVERASR